MATLLWSQEFNTGTLDIKSASNPNGLWMPVDFWQNINQGWKDFSGTNWNINPNDPAFAGYDPFSVQNGYLQITETRTPTSLYPAIQSEMTAQGVSGPVPSWMGGELITNRADVTFTYGYFEFRERIVNGGKGEFPAMWFYSANESGDAQGKSMAEIDLYEIFGTPGKWSTTLHGAGTTNVGTTTDPASVDGWHTYGMNWQPNLLQFFEDGKLIYQVTGAAASYYNDLKMAIRVNFAMDAPWFPTSAHSDGTTPSPMEMQIDYIRQYDVPPSPGDVPPPSPSPPPPTTGTDDTMILSATQWNGHAPIDMGGGNDTLIVTEHADSINGQPKIPTVTNVEHGYLVGTAGTDWGTYTGAELDGILIGADAHIDLGAGFDSIATETTSVDLNALGANDAAIKGVEEFIAYPHWQTPTQGPVIDMHGQSENLIFMGDNANDTFIGGTGHDIFTGRGGSDLFGVSDGDVIRDFVHGQDHIKVAANVNLAAITTTESGGNTYVHVDNATTVLLTGINLHVSTTDFTH